ncbi:MAG: energy transducer TonB [Bacteroidia bacterium]|nr:energy transducer TonB [Bacteroidia bacterium]
MDYAKTAAKDRAIAGSGTVGFLLLMLLFLIWYKIIPPDPPFEPSLKAGIEVDFGTDPEGMGNDHSMTPYNPDDANNSNNSSSPTSPPDDQQLTQDDGEVPTKPKTDKPKTNTTNADPTDQNLLNALNNIGNDGPTNNSSDGDGNKPGNQGDPNGTNSNNYDGPPGEGGPGLQWSLNGRKMKNPPPAINDFDEEGVIVVDITVNEKGKVTWAEVNRSKSKNPNYSLCQKARQAAFLTKFSESGGNNEQRGSITFIFTLK